MTASKLTFPIGFEWGVATSAYQIEGGVLEDGRGESIWDHFSHTPGKIHENESGDIACDHYHRLDQDLDLLHNLGVTTYRFSIAWPRIFPAKGKVEERGINFYRRLIDGLHQRGITPTVTIYHWDLPQWLQDEGGWVNRETVDHFVEYARLLFQEFGSLVPRWITHNEPWCTAFLGYGLGVHAPGIKDWGAAARAAHHVLLSHGLVVKEFHRLDLKGEIGITLNLNHVEAASDSDPDRLAADLADEFSNRWFLDSIFKGRYPQLLKEGLFNPHLGNWDFVQSGDLEVISTPIDFLGINYYSRTVVRYKEDEPMHVERLTASLPTTEMGWEIYPHGLYLLLKRVREEYTGELPLFITENGAAFTDEVTENGAKGKSVVDTKRVEFLHDHFDAALRFIREGGPLRGYYVWSLMDNFEWAEGYSKRFGLVYVDYATQERILKNSAKFYQRVISQNGIEAVLEPHA